MPTFNFAGRSHADYLSLLKVVPVGAIPKATRVPLLDFWRDTEPRLSEMSRCPAIQKLATCEKKNCGSAPSLSAIAMQNVAERPRTKAQSAYRGRRAAESLCGGSG
jgi:hypothetical protein